MIPSSSDFLRALRLPIKEFYLKIEFYDSKMNYLNEFTKQITENDIGSITVDSSRAVRRSFQFTLLNKHGEFLFGSDKLIWLNKRVRVYTGLKLTNQTIEYIPQGVFVLTELKDTDNENGSYTTISGQDKMYLQTDKRGSLKYDTELAVGLNIGEAIKVLARNNGETLFNFDTVTETIPYTLTYQAGDSTYKAYEELSLLAKCDLYYDVNGYLRLRKIDLNSFEHEPSVWKVDSTNPNERFYAGNQRSLEDTIANHIVVLGGSGQTATQKSELIVTETDTKWKNSPYTVESIGRITYWHNNGEPDSLLGGEDNGPVLWRAKYELLKRLSYSERLSLNLAPIYALEANDIIEVNIPNNSVNGKYLIQSLNIPLKPEIMTCDCLKYVKVIDDWDFL